MTLASILLLGFLIGMRHATEADHLAAVATLATRCRSVAQTIGQGMAWGAGHTLTLLLFGGTVLVLGLFVPPRAAQALELAVGVMLVLLGTDVLYRLRRDRIHVHRHCHANGIAHFHAHAHRDTKPEEGDGHHDHGHPSRFPYRALVVGMVHGMAGSAALVLLSVQAIKSVAWGFAYIAVFGLGSMLGMALLSAVIAVPMRLAARRLTLAHGSLSGIVGLATIVLGFYVLYQNTIAT